MKKLQLDFNSENYRLNNPALTWSDGSISYAEYLNQINQTAEVFKSHEIGEGSRVAVLSDIDYRFPIIFFAILHLKAIVIPLNTRLPIEQIIQQIEQVNCQCLITFDDSVFPSGISDISIVSIKDIFGQKKSLNNGETGLTFSLEQKATILFTSGSSGKAKAVIHSIGNHYYSALGSNTNILLKPGDSWLISLPFCHVAGIAILFRTMLAGGTSVIGQKDQPIHEQLMNKKITHLSLVPTQLHRLLENPLDSEIKKALKTVLIGGSSCSDLLLNRALQERLPLYLSYGSTEMSSQITTTRPFENLNDKITSGSILPYRELKINQNHEILVRGKTLASGYWKQAEVKSIVDEEGWFHTGDLGYLDEEKRLILKGRKDNMFISGGENIYPEEVERILIQFDDIVEACVVDIPDDEYGTRPVAFLQMKDNEHIEKKVITDFLRGRISGIKIPVRYIEWPIEEQLKPNRKKLRILAQELVFPE